MLAHLVTGRYYAATTEDYGYTSSVLPARSTWLQRAIAILLRRKQ